MTSVGGKREHLGAFFYISFEIRVHSAQLWHGKSGLLLSFHFPFGEISLLRKTSFFSNSSFCFFFFFGFICVTLTAKPFGFLFAATGAVSSASQKYDSLSDNVDRGSSDALQSVIRSSEQASSKLSFVPVRGKKREMLIDDVVGSPSSRVMSSLDSPVLGGLKGKRTERDRAQNRDNLRSNSVPGRGHSSLDSFPSDRKTKAKHKQKNSHLSTSGCGSHGRSTEAIEPTCPPVRGSSQQVGMVGGKINPKGVSRLPSNIPQESSKEVKKQSVPSAKLQPSELDPMEALGVSNELDGHQDLSSWLNFDEDGLQDHDSIGLEIPMDDLSEILM